MEINYIRNLMASYMVIEQDEEPAEWEKEMIRHIKIEGMVFADYVCDNGQNQFWYDISGKQALDVVFETVHLNHEMLCGLLMGIYEMLGRLEAFLLRSEGLLLRPECIFFDNIGRQIYFCYCPGVESALPERFIELMEYLLSQLDHSDEAAVELAYNLYEQAVKEGFCLRELKNLLRMNYDQEADAQDEADEAAEMDSEKLQKPYAAIGRGREEKRREEKYKGRRGKEEKYRDERYREENDKEVNYVEEKYNEEIVKKGAVRRGTERGGAVKEKTGKKNISFIEDIRGKIKQNIMEIKESFPLPMRAHRKKPESEEHFVFEPDEEQEVKQSRPTVLLSELTKTIEGVLRYEGNGEVRDLKIEDVPYVIGSDASCDGYIPSSTVSRKHARITRKEDIYFIEDLNSSNGTAVGGELLNYRTKMSLEKNEIVMFADEKFRFI